jgi:hypothetical protein
VIDAYDENDSLSLDHYEKTDIKKEQRQTTTETRPSEEWIKQDDFWSHETQEECYIPLSP